MNSNNITNSSLTEEQIKGYTKRLVLARMRILDKHGFYGIMLMHMKFSLDPTCATAYTDGAKIGFSPKFMDELSDDELEFILMHEILHVALKHCFRGQDYEQYVFNIACDIVVNSNILKSNGGDLNTITLKNYGESMHLINNKEGYDYTAEEVYELLLQDKDIQKYLKDKEKMLKALEEAIKRAQKGKPDDDGNKKGKKGSESEKGDDAPGPFIDDHSKWRIIGESDQSTIDNINKLICEAAASVGKRGGGSSEVPLGVQRKVDQLLHPTIDWRILLNDFIQSDNIDYSFNPPDNRYNDFDFFMPDFNVKDEKVEKILFMVDTSGSIDNKQLALAYSEIKGAIEQFDTLEGYLGFFDGCVYDPIPFDNVDDMLAIKPKGGGGTSFHCIFNYIKDKMELELPKYIVIITDGYAPYPTEEECLNLPVLWIINNDVATPTYGAIARIKNDD